MDRLSLAVAIAGVVIIILTVANMTLFLQTMKMRDDTSVLVSKGDALNRKFLYEVEKQMIRFDGILKEMSKNG